jgi:hypothetical protein
VLTRIMRKITQIAGAVGTKLRDRSRSMKLRLLEIGRVARAKARSIRKAEAALCSIVEHDESGGWTGEALLR